MGIIKQTVVCVIIGIVFMGCQNSQAEVIQKLAAKTEEVILKDYSASDIKVVCKNTLKTIQELPEKTRNAIDYTEETMEKYRSGAE